MDREDDSKGYQVRDRRRFTETGEPRDAVAEERREETGAPEAAGAKAAPESGPRRPAEAKHEEEPITLGAFLVSLSTQALVLLGEIPSPITGKSETDLPGVREIIDLIAMLQEKTRGNVEPAEAQLFDKILYDLRMRYVEKVRA